MGDDKINNYLILLLSLASILSAEPENDEGNDATADITDSRGKLSFHKGSQILNPGIAYGGSYLGVEYEYGLLNYLGIEMGAGYPGINVGFHIHCRRSKHVNLYFAPNLLVMPLDDSYGPFINLGSRFYFGTSARVGISFMILFGYISRKLGNYKMLTMGIGVPIRIK
jgi:hypothetical protein